MRNFINTSNILKIKEVYINDVKIPMLSGKPLIDDDTGETG